MLQPVYGRRAKIVMWIEDDPTTVDEDDHDSALNMQHLMRHHYVWSHKDLHTSFHGSAYFMDYKSYESTLRAWNKHGDEFMFGGVLTSDLFNASTAP